MLGLHRVFLPNLIGLGQLGVHTPIASLKWCFTSRCFLLATPQMLDFVVRNNHLGCFTKNRSEVWKQQRYNSVCHDWLLGATSTFYRRNFICSKSINDQLKIMQNPSQGCGSKKGSILLLHVVATSLSPGQCSA